MTGPSLRSLVERYGVDLVDEALVRELNGVADACGGGVEPSTLGQMAQRVRERWGGRTPNALLLALREGLDKGKIFGKLSYPIVAEWMNEHEAKVEEYYYNQHLATKSAR